MSRRATKIKVQSPVWVLLSGGIDSTSCLHFYIKQGNSPQAIFIDYGQPSARREWQAASAIAQHYHIQITRIRWSGSRKKSGELSGRNAFFIFGSLLEIGDKTGILAAGFHAGTPYYDCSSSFINQCQEILDGYTQGKVQLGVPFLTWTKRDIWAFCNAESIPTELTYSCERGMKQPCGVCLSCKDLEALNAL